MDSNLLNALRPDEMALREWVRPLLTPQVIETIASMDYGQHVEENRDAIDDLRTIKRLPQELPFPPRAVFELASNHKPDSRQEQAARLFACVVIVHSRDAARPGATMAALVESAVELGPEAIEEAVRYLAWCRLNEPGSWPTAELTQRPFLTLGLLLAYLLSPLRLDQEVVSELARTVIAEVNAAMAEEHPWWPDQPPAKVLKRAVGGGAFRTWRALIERCGKVEAIEPVRGWFTPG